MNIADFDYSLPNELIAQTPVEPRDRSRLMVLSRSSRSIAHGHFFELPRLLNPGDVLVFNDTRVIPARLQARKDSGAKLEILLLTRLEPRLWQALVRPARRMPVGTRFIVNKEGSVTEGLSGTVVGALDAGVRVIKLENDAGLASLGAMPLPPYIHAPLADPERYQTVYSRVEGSAAAPTAGLHFTPTLLSSLKARGIRTTYVTLHVGLDTFQPVRETDPSTHKIHREFGSIPVAAAEEILSAKEEGRRVICVGTTSMRLVEAAAASEALTRERVFSGWVDLFILPGYRFRVADAMITNFHLPRTTLIMLVSAFAGRDLVLDAYREAIREQYRFYSFGDAMLIT